MITVISLQRLGIDQQLILSMQHPNVDPEHLRPHQAIIWSWKPSNRWQAKTTHSGNTSPKQPAQTTLPTIQAPGGTKTIHSFCSDLREHICGLNTQSGSRSPLKRLSESLEEAAVLEPDLRAVLGSQEAVFGTPVQNNRIKPHCRLYKLQVAQKNNTLVL